jgi:hypothetical protein
MTAQFHPGICHSSGTSGVARITIPTMTRVQRVSESQKRFKILGTSMKKLDRSTSFDVAPQVMLYENKCAKRATERWMLSPPKKKKLYRTGVRITRFKRCGIHTRMGSMLNFR